MKNKFSKMMFAFLAAVALSVSTVSATWVNVEVTPGSWAAEISWSLSDASGTIVASTNPGYYSLAGLPVDFWVNVTDGCHLMEQFDSFGDGWNGATYRIVDSAGTVYGTGGLLSGSYQVDYIGINAVCALGCTDPLATNYDPTAAVDDGSCTYPTTCIASDSSESFEVDFGIWVQDPANTLNWTIDALGTTSGGTGPSAAFDGVNYIYTETSGGSNATASIIAECIDLSGWTSPSFVFAYHMYGATMGTLNIDVSIDSGATWTNEWTLSGDQGNAWFEAVVDLSAYSGNVSVRVQALTGTSFTSDMAVDLLRFMEAPVAGCTDPFASNYNASATIDDGSCLFPGCLDPLATNYCATCNVNDSTSCVYPQCNALDFSEDFESANLSGNGWTTLSGVDAAVSLNSANAIGDTVSLMFTGGTFANFPTPTTEAAAFALTDHLSSATVCLDMSSAASIVNLTFDAELIYGFSANYTWMRVTIDGTPVADVNGNTSYNATPSGVNTYTYDLSAWSGQSSVYVTFEAVCKYDQINQASLWDAVILDNINVFSVYPCTYYASSATATDATCNGGTDGTATVTVTSGVATADTYLWSDGQTTATATGLAAGTYTVTTTDSLNGCTSTSTVTVGEPSALTASAVILNTTSPLDSNGAVDLSIAGGSPCYSGSNTVSGTTPNNSFGGNVFNVIASNDLGISSLDLFVQAGIGTVDVFYRNGTCEGFELNASAWTNAASVQNMSNVPGLMNVPVAIPMSAGDTVGIYVICSDGMQYTSGNAPAYTQVLGSDANLTITNGAGIGSYVPFSGSLFGPPLGARDFSGNVNYGTASYTYAWSNGATSQDVSSLSMGPISCTITDCNGCTTTWNGFVMAMSVPGCTDTLASNYNPSANLDDGSCTYPGCTDSVATNYDPSANLDDGSCTYTCAYYGYDDEITVTFVSDFWASESEWWVISFSGDTVLQSTPYVNGTATYVSSACAYNDCYTFVMADAFGDGGGQSTVTNSNGDTLGVFSCVGTGNSGTFGLNTVCISGCMDSTATNYDPTATINDSTACIYCTDNLITLNMYDSFGDGWNGSAIIVQDVTTSLNIVATTLPSGLSASSQYCIVDGCYTIDVSGGSFPTEVSWEILDENGDTLAFGGAPFTGSLTLGSANCVSGCTDVASCNYNPAAVFDDGSCDYSCIGCSDSTAYNYGGSGITIDDGSCLYCTTTASAVATDAADSTSATGTVDLTLAGSNCVTNVDLLVSVAGGNGQNGNAFNIINTSGAPLYIDGFSQGPGSGNTTTTTDLEVFCSYGDYTAIGAAWTSVATATGVTLTTGATTGYIQIPGGVTIPAGGTYGFWVGSSNGGVVQYTNGTGTPGVSAWASDANITVTEGHGGTYPTGLNFSPRNWNGMVHYGDPNASVATYLWSNGDTTEDLAAVPYGTYTVTGTDCNGCSFSASATVGVTLIPGCTDPLAFNYDSTANFDDGSCIPVVNGCTDSTAANYDPTANTDDGSCHFCFGNNSVLVECDGGSFQSEVSWYLTNANGDTVLNGGAPFSLNTCLDDGCYTLLMVDSWGDGWNGNTFSITETVSGTSVSATLTGGSAGTASLSSPALGCFVYGCTDPLATNYDATANTDDGSCTYATCVDGSQAICEDFESGGGNMTFTSGINAGGGVLSGYGNNSTYAWVGQGLTFAGYGATPTTGALAFDPSKSTHFAKASYCVDLTTVAPGSQVALNFDYRGEYSFSANYSWMRIMVDTVQVNTLSGQAYLQPNAAVGTWESHSIDLSAYVGTVVDVAFETSCKYNIGYTTAGAGGDMGSVDNVCIVAPTYGCTDTIATNYNPAANIDDGSCVYPACAAPAPYHQEFSTGALPIGFCTPQQWAIIATTGGPWAFSGTPGYTAGGNGRIPGTYAWIDFSGTDVGVILEVENVDASTLTTPTLYFDYYSDLGASTLNGLPNIMHVEAYDGTSWNTIDSLQLNASGWNTYSYDLTNYLNSGIAEIRFRGESGGASNDYINDLLLDDVKVDNFAVFGCTDPNATNYNPSATSDDGSCTYPCLDNSVALTMFDSFGDGWNGATYDVSTGGVSVATGGLLAGFVQTDSLCLVTGCYDITVTPGSFPSEVSFNFGSVVGGTPGTYTNISVGGVNCGPILGCTDSTATNYDPTATQDDGSCTYCTGTFANISVGGGSFQSEVSWTLSDGNGNVILAGGAPFSLDTCLADDCYTVDMVDSWGDGWNGNTFDVSDNGVVIATGGLLSGSAGSFTFSTGSALCPVPGCTDSTASNYDPTATVDDGSCTYPCLLDEVILTLTDSYGDGWNGNSVTVNGVNYTQTGTYSFPYTANSSETVTLCVDLTTCIDVIYNATGSWQTENSWTVTDQSGNVLASGGANSGQFGACGTPDCNGVLNGPAVVDSCGDCNLAYVYNFMTNIPSYVNDTAGITLGMGEILVLPGDPGDPNFNATCSGCTDSTAVNYDPTATLDNGSCIATVLGCTDSTAFNYNPLANVDDGSCTPVLYGCTDPTALNYYAAANTDDGSCIFAVYGCTDSTATNYNPLANIDDGTCNYDVYGCTDPNATNYDPTATIDDGSCTYPSACAKPIPTGFYVSEVIHNRVRVHWDNMTSAICLPKQYRIQYREVGQTAWSQKNAQDAGLCNFGLSTTSKRITNLSPNTTYEWRMKAWYCNTTGASIWSAIQTFTTAPECPNVINFSVTTPLTTRAVFTWDTTGSYSFARIKLRIDSISNPTGTDWISAGGFGVNYPTLTRNKNGLTPGQTYRGQARTWCDPSGGMYKSSSWTPLIFWTQPTSIRVDGGTAINNLDVYPNPSRDIFNVKFTSEDIQDLEVRIINVIGEVVYTENLEEFVGEYTKQVDLATYTKGVYFLEITTDNGVINKKLILQ